MITYLDADIFFFADPAPIYDEIGEHSIVIIERRFSPNLYYLKQRGIYNVGWLSFRRDTHALACLYWWRERCLEWCYDRYDDNHFADQKYLDNWPDIFKNVIVLQHKGANLAPWNLTNYKIQTNENYVWVDEQPLIFFHFHGLRQIRTWLYDPQLAEYKVKQNKPVRQNIYMPYIQTLQQLSTSLGDRFLQPGIRRPADNLQMSWSMEKLFNLLRVVKGVFSRRYILVVYGCVV
jgi:hypothetical protein